MAGSKRAPLNLPSAPAQYSADYMQRLSKAVIEADAKNLKNDQEINAVRLVLTDTVTSARYQVTVASGVLTVTAL